MVPATAGGPGGPGGPPKKVKSFVDVIAQSTSVGEFFLLIW